MPEAFIDFIGQFKGEAAALGVAFLWASATIIFSRVGKDVPPLNLNLLKNVIGLALLATTLVLSGELYAVLETRALVLLLLSGAVGIGAGDTLFFEGLNCLGARRMLLLTTIAPPLTAVIALVFLSEALTISAWSGIVITVAGVAWVVTERERGAPGGALRIGRGVGFGLLACLGQAAGAVLSRAALTETGVSLLWSAVLRLAAGAGFVLLWLLAARRPSSRWTGPRLGRTGPSRGRIWIGPPGRLWVPLIFATFIGTYLAIWLQQVSLKFASAGVAQTLISTSPLFVLPIAACMGERITFRAVLGAAVALFGVAMLFGLA